MIIEQIFDILNSLQFDYCVQNKYEQMPEKIPSDIDIMYRNCNEKELDLAIRKISKETGLIITQKIVQDYREYTYILSYPIPRERFQLQLDFYNVISHGKYHNLLLSKDLLDRRIKYKNFYIPSPEDEIIYILIRRTLKKDFNGEHLKKIATLYDEKEHKDLIINKFGEDVLTLLEKMINKNNVEIFYINYEIFEDSIKKISRQNYKLIDRIKYRIFKMKNYFSKRIMHKCGLSVAFLAPDGTGKSTIISKISDTCSGSFYGVEQFYFRPRVLKNMGHYNKLNQHEEATSNDNPHGKKLDGKIKSIIRFLYYNLDFIIGMKTKISFLLMRKKLVIFDRYYYDYYADMKRYGYSLSSRIAHIFSIFIPKPNMIIVLDAPAEIIYSRKKELKMEEIEYQRKEFEKLKKYRNCFVIDTNKEIDDVFDDVTRIILDYQRTKTNKILKK